MSVFKKLLYFELQTVSRVYGTDLILIVLPILMFLLLLVYISHDMLKLLITVRGRCMCRQGIHWECVPSTLSGEMSRAGADEST